MRHPEFALRVSRHRTKAVEATMIAVTQRFGTPGGRDLEEFTIQGDHIHMACMIGRDRDWWISKLSLRNQPSGSGELVHLETRVIANEDRVGQKAGAEPRD